MGTHCNSILQLIKPLISKSKACFENLVPRSFRWHLDIEQNLTAGNLKLDIKRNLNRKKKMSTKPIPHHGEKVTSQYRELNLLMGEGWFGANLSLFFAVRENFLIFDCKSLAVLFCSMSRCHLKDLGTTDLTLWNIWFWKSQNWVAMCPHIGGTLCINKFVPHQVHYFVGQSKFSICLEWFLAKLQRRHLLILPKAIWWQKCQHVSPKRNMELF